MKIAIKDSLSHLGSSDNVQDGEDENDEVTVLGGKPSEDDETSWVMGTTSKMVQQHIERFRQ